MLEIAKGFIYNCVDASDIDKFLEEHKKFCDGKRTPNVPHIIAVGPGFANIDHYEIIVFQNRYSEAKIRDAVALTYKILWALNLPYPKDCLPVWSIIELVIYNSKPSPIGCNVHPVINMIGEDSEVATALGIFKHFQYGQSTSKSTDYVS